MEFLGPCARYLFSLGFVFLSIVTLKAENLNLDMARLADSAFANFKPITAPQPPSSSSVFCNAWGAAPDQSPWVVSSSDVDGNFVVLKYSVPDHLPLPGAVPRHIIFSWQRDGLYAPWIVYYGSETISPVKINSVGDVAFWHVNNQVAPSSPVVTELVSCSIDPLNKNSQYLAYPCATSISSARIVDQILHNHTAGSLLGLQLNQPDGKFFEFDWSYDRLIYSRTSHSLLLASVNSWDRFTFQIQNIESYFSSANSTNFYWLRQVDSQGVVGLGFTNFMGFMAGGLSMTLKGASVQGLGSSAFYLPALLYDTQPSFASLTSFGYSKFGTEFFGFSSLLPLGATSSQGRLGLRSSEDNFGGYYGDRVVSPNPGVILRKPLKINSQALGEALIVEAYNPAAQSVSLELYQYQPSGIAGMPGTFQFIETITPTAGFASMMMLSATDIQGFSAIMVSQFPTTQTTSGLHTLYSCF